MDKDFSLFEKKIGIEFKNKDLLKQAFIHRSYINEHKDVGMGHNERLEFLGDAVLELVSTDFLYKKFPQEDEGRLTAYRAALVNTVSISRAALAFGANDFLLLSKGEAKDTGRAREYILANTFEAVVGAIYLDQGYSVAEDFIATHLLPYIDEVVHKQLWQDAKSFFQEKAQEHRSITPQYKVLQEVGPDHDKVFTVGVFLDEEQISQGSGKSKQHAEQDAARNALEKMGWN